MRRGGGQVVEGIQADAHAVARRVGLLGVGARPSASSGGTSASSSAFHCGPISVCSCRTESADRPSANTACSKCRLPSAEQVLDRGAQVVADVVGQEAEHALAVAARHEAAAQQRHGVGGLVQRGQLQAQQFVEQAARVHVARHRLRQRLEARRRAQRAAARAARPAHPDRPGR